MAATSSTSSATSTASMASSPNTTCNFNDQACGVPSSGTLYLFTFLATLIMLSAVAGAIVVRSMIIRRRQRERINQAVANGTYMSPSHRGRVDINAKPSMYEVCLDFKDTETDEKSWNGTQPCSAAYTIIPSPSVCDLPKSPHRDSSAPSVSPRRRHFLNPFRSSASPMPPTETAIPMTVTPPRPTSSPRLQARLIFMISMPSPIQPLPTDDRLVLPGLEFGLADVDVLLCSERIEDALLEIKGPGHSNDKDGSDMPPSP